jgi:hypothetical protein
MHPKANAHGRLPQVISLKGSLGYLPLYFKYNVMIKGLKWEKAWKKMNLFFFLFPVPFSEQCF